MVSKFDYPPCSVIQCLWAVLTLVRDHSMQSTLYNWGKKQQISLKSQQINVTIILYPNIFIIQIKIEKQWKIQRKKQSIKSNQQNKKHKKNKKNNIKTTIQCSLTLNSTIKNKNSNNTKIK